MQVDYVLILAAGKGTRMGNAGKQLPKVIWPIFEKSLLELEVEYAQKFNPKKIFINLFHEKDNLENIILKKIKNEKIEIIKENERLDIGGAIHNLAKKVDYKGRLLVINSDQFIMLNDKVTTDFSSLSESSAVCLLSYSVATKEGYNALNIVKDKFYGITPNREIKSKMCETYTGMSCINLEQLEKISGESKFFESIANPEKREIKVLNIKTSRYWDFGTLRRYYDSMFEILDRLNTSTPDAFTDFLKSTGAINLEKIGKGGYGAMTGIIDLGNNTSVVKNTIYLAQSNVIVSENESIVTNSTEDLIPSLD